MDGHVTLSVDHRYLPHIAVLVRGEQCSERLVGGEAGAHQPQAEGAVGHLHERLGRHGADAGLGPGDDGAHREPVRLHGHTELAGGGVLRHDRIGVDRA